MPKIGKGLEKYIEGLNNLPETAAGYKQKPVPEGFGWKPSDADTQRAIAMDMKLAPIERQIFMENRRDPEKEMAQNRPRIGSAAPKSPGMGIGLQRLLQDVTGAVKDPIERLGAGIKKQVGSLADLPNIDVNNLPDGKIDPNKGAEMSMDLLQTTPIGAVGGMIRQIGKEVVEHVKPSKIPEDWMGEKIAHELGDVTITRSAKFPDKVQVTYWAGKAGVSPTVGDEVFDSVEEARKAVKQ